MGVGRRNLVHAPRPRKDAAEKCRPLGTERPFGASVSYSRDPDPAPAAIFESTSQAVWAGKRHLDRLPAPVPPPVPHFPRVPVSPDPWASTDSAGRASAAPRGPEAFSSQVRKDGA